MPRAIIKFLVNVCSVFVLDTHNKVVVLWQKLTNNSCAHLYNINITLTYSAVTRVMGIHPSWKPSCDLSLISSLPMMLTLNPVSYWKGWEISGSIYKLARNEQTSHSKHCSILKNHYHIHHTFITNINKLIMTKETFNNKC